jgi:chromosome partition protein MukF
MRDSDHHRTLARLAQRRASLKVDTAELCCLAAMHLQADLGASTLFDEARLTSLFEVTIEAFEPGAENPRSRATHAIERLRAQRLILRLDGAGVVQAGEYALSQLAIDIVKRFLVDDRLTREHLDGLMNSVLSGLGDVRAAAQKASTEDAWRIEVRLPVELVVAELLNGVERRQLGLDEHWRAVRAEITRLLEVDWLDALGGIEALLEATAETLGELKTLLLQHANRAHGLLDDVHELAMHAGRIETLIALRRTGDQLDRLLAWGQSRHAAWSDYHRSVHRFLRDVVRLDPDRQLSTRLRAQITGWSAQPFALRLPEGPRLIALRVPEKPVERPPVLRERRDWSSPVSEHDERPAIELETLVDGALLGATRLSTVVERVLSQVDDPAARYGLIGRVAARVAHRAQDGFGADGPWIPVGDGQYELTDWKLSDE